MMPMSTLPEIETRPSLESPRPEKRPALEHRQVKDRPGEGRPGEGQPRRESREPTPAAFEIERLSLFYGQTAALRNVDLQIPEGEITALIGPSGCGKTSLLSSLNRLTDLIAGCRVEGQVRWRGQDLRALDAMSLRRRVGMIFQKPSPFPLSIRRNLDLPLREHGVKDKRERQDRLEATLRDVGLWNEVCDRLDSSALALSGGQQQRLCIARALVLRPEVILFDEPCSALDPISSGVVEDLIADLRGRYTVVIVTHNLAQARRIADHTAFFWLVDGAGQLVESGPTTELLESPKDPLTRAYVSGARG